MFGRNHPSLRQFAAGAALLLGVVGCGAGAPTILNTEKVERAIEHSSQTQRSIAARVSCPSGVHQKQGLAFACTATTAAGPLTVTVTQLNGSGSVHYEVR
jgi:hypothetical protein